jgi:hypothetical protein
MDEIHVSGSSDLLVIAEEGVDEEEDEEEKREVTLSQGEWIG